MDERNYDDEISIKELIMVLINNWKLIVGITVLITILGGVYAFVIASPTYESKIEGTISIPETVETKYGSYVFPSTNPKDYLSVIQSNHVLEKTLEELELESTIEGLKNRIVVNNEDKSSVFSFVVTGGAPEETKRLLDTLTDQFMKEINLIYKEKSIGYFQRVYGVEVGKYEDQHMRLEQEIKNTEALLLEIDPTITLKKLVLNDPVYAAQLAQERDIVFEDLSEAMMLEEIVNPNYSEMENQMISLKKELTDLELMKASTDRALLELELEKRNIMTYRKENDPTVMQSGLLEVMKPNVLVNEEASLPINPVAPKKMLIVVIAFILGAMLSIFVAFFKAYWQGAK